MVTVEDIRQLPRREKLRVMEMIWSDLTGQGDDAIESPAWHEQELAETAQRVAEGTEVPVDWFEAKDRLRGEE